jgi:hypothetical protein
MDGNCHLNIQVWEDVLRERAEGGNDAAKGGEGSCSERYSRRLSTGTRPEREE